MAAVVVENDVINSGPCSVALKVLKQLIHELQLITSFLVLYAFPVYLAHCILKRIEQIQCSTAPVGALVCAQRRAVLYPAVQLSTCMDGLSSMLITMASSGEARYKPTLSAAFVVNSELVLAHQLRLRFKCRLFLRMTRQTKSSE